MTETAPSFTAASPTGAVGVQPPFDAGGGDAGDRGYRVSLAPAWYTLVTVATVAFLYLFPYIAYIWLGKGRADTILMETALTLAIAAMGLNLAAGYTGMLSLGHGAFMVGGALVMVKLSGIVMGPGAAMVAAILWGFAIGALVAFFCVHLKGFYLSVVTFLAAGVVPVITLLFVRLVAVAVSGGATATKAANATSVAKRLGFVTVLPGQGFGQFLPSEASDKAYYYLLVVPAVVIVLAITALLVRSALGRAWKAIRDSEIAARACGVPVYGYRLLSFSISAGIAALAGVLYVENPNNSQVQTSNFGYALSFELVFYVLLGGLGTIGGPLVGSILLGVGANAFFSAAGIDQRPGAVPIILGTLLLLNMILVPNGVIGFGRDVKRRRDRESAQRGKLPRRPRPPVVTDADRLPHPAHTVQSWQGRALLELRDVSKVFGGLRAVDRVDIAVVPGSIHSIIGPNGSGKTTTINTITGFYAADEGRVLFQGKDVTSEASQRRAHRGMTRTFQNLQVFRQMSCLENVMVGMHPRTHVPASLLPWKDRHVKARAFGLLAFVDLAHRAFEPAGSLPYAEQRRLEIARALAADPDLILLDEPAAGMNPAETNELTALIREINAHGMTVLLIEHHMDLVMSLSHNITVLDFGTKIAEGTPQQVQSDPRVIEAYLGAGAS